jgi:hypothetical protein
MHKDRAERVVAGKAVARDKSGVALMHCRVEAVLHRRYGIGVALSASSVLLYYRP